MRRRAVITGPTARLSCRASVGDPSGGLQAVLDVVLEVVAVFVDGDLRIDEERRLSAPPRKETGTARRYNLSIFLIPDLGHVTPHPQERQERLLLRRVWRGMSNGRLAATRNARGWPTARHDQACNGPVHPSESFSS